MEYKITGNLTIPSLDGVEIQPGVTILGEPSIIPGTNKMLALANVAGTLCRVELKITFKAEESPGG